MEETYREGSRRSCNIYRGKQISHVRRGRERERESRASPGFSAAERWVPGYITGARKPVDFFRNKLDGNVVWRRYDADRTASEDFDFN